MKPDFLTIPPEQIEQAKARIFKNYKLRPINAQPHASHNHEQRPIMQKQQASREAVKRSNIRRFNPK